MKNQARLLSATAGIFMVCTTIYPADDVPALNAPSFDIPDSHGITMLRIEPGTFSMGSPAGEIGRGDDELQHTVTLSKPFYMSETEITQDQYLPVMVPDYTPIFIRQAAYEHSLPELHQGGPYVTESKYLGPTDKNPMEGISWTQAVEFCRELTRKEARAGRVPAGYAYRLPTEAEWEYACRAGTTGAFNTTGNLKYFCWGPDVGILKWTAPVKGERTANAWGLYDMHGNVYEWCLDWYGPYSRSDSINPAGPAKGNQKVARGGSWMSGVPLGEDDSDAVRLRYMRSASRNRFPPGRPLSIIGFRPVLAPVSGSSTAN